MKDVRNPRRRARILERPKRKIERSRARARERDSYLEKMNQGQGRRTHRRKCSPCSVFCEGPCSVFCEGDVEGLVGKKWGESCCARKMKLNKWKKKKKKLRTLDTEAT